ncbi:hypothetical protein F1188_11765 [Roseospira marina]|uniref:Uncharacterized protein n=1 Tax=Roseospira marina TaxID=140057 RepID=A0A5M6IAE8_9PROT|nr:hypothetical protein [Roseospira marina]KAA5605240.1 hypothetical protein F1188_11765 [Roseospira marina]MBB4314699.1 hypothetical protein [Roseospira marina]MBB5087688.1 hypothetical protein [Roseospira marina]
MPYVHAVPGRLRLKSRPLSADTRATRAACHALRRLPGVEDVTHKPRAASLIVLFDPAATRAEDILDAATAQGLMPAGTTAPASPAPTRPSAAPLASVASGAVASQALTLLGGAFGKAVFGAVLKTSVERGVSSLVTAAIR